MFADYPLVTRAILDWAATAQGLTAFSVEEHDGIFRVTMVQDGRPAEFVYSDTNGGGIRDSETTARMVWLGLENARKLAAGELEGGEADETA
jgi:hypothetical protein